MPRGNKPGQRRGGRAKGVKNKATVERELLAADVARRQMAKAQQQGRELAVESLERYAKLFEGAAGIFRPVTDEEIAAGRAPNPLGNWDQFRTWLVEARDTMKELAKYQSPQLRAIAIAPTPQSDEGERRKTFTLTIFEGGRALSPPIVDVTPKREGAA